MNDNIIITIGRLFGSGGRELGRKIASKLGIAYYDKELLSLAAEDGTISEDYLEVNDERTPPLINTVLSPTIGFSTMSWYQTPGNIGVESAYVHQCNAIRKIAAEQSCVIVGRTADYILRDNPNTVSIFVHAPAEECIDRIVERCDVADRNKARSLMEKTNRLRAHFYNFYTEKRWGDPRSYDLCIDTSKMPTDAIADAVIAYIKLRFPQKAIGGKG